MALYAIAFIYSAKTSSVEKYTNLSRPGWYFLAKSRMLTVPTTLSITNSMGYSIDLIKRQKIDFHFINVYNY